LFKYKDGKILLDDNKAEQARAEASTESCAESEALAGSITTAIADEAVEFNPSAFSDEDASDAPWVM
jgi:hypothetical protein